MGATYRYEGVVVARASDGSLKHDGAMGAAFLTFANKVPARTAPQRGCIRVAGVGDVHPTRAVRASPDARVLPCSRGPSGPH